MCVKVSTFGALNPITEAALTWYDAGCSIIPIRADGTKIPRIEWKPYTQAPPLRIAITPWFQDHRVGIGVVCGKVSGNLEMLELEGRATSSEDLNTIVEQCELRGVDQTFHQLLTEGYAEWTPSGGLHFLYRITDHEVPGNTKIARRPATAEELAAAPDDKIKVLSETRGEGGYVIVAPTAGTVHPTGEAWTVAAGKLGVIPTITWATRNKLVEAIHAALDRMPAEAPRPARPAPASLLTARTDRPGDDFNAKASWEEILIPHGWQIHHHSISETFWTRPGKKRGDGHSATTGLAGTGNVDRLYVFSSATEFTPETPYSKFAAYTLLEFNGDFSAATKALAAAGYGTPVRSSLVVHHESAPAAAWQHAVEEATTNAVARIDAADAVAVQDPGWKYVWPRPHIAADAYDRYPTNQMGVGQLYANVYKDTFRYMAEHKRWMFFNGKHWERDRSELHEQAVKHLLQAGLLHAKQMMRAEDDNAKEFYKFINRACNATTPPVARWARSEPEISATLEDFDQHRHLVTVDNGVLDLDSMALEPHNPDLMLTRTMRVEYDKDAQAPKWDKFLTDILPNPDTRDYLQRALGQTLLGDAGQRALFLLHGAPGTGKSQVVKVMELLFGDFAETAQATAFNEASKKAAITNDLNDLRGKRFVSISELDEGERLNEALVKRLTGGDTAKSRGLYQENTQWRVEFGLWMCTNFLPKLNSDDSAMWKRVKPIHFPVVVADLGKPILNFGEQLYAQEASGILNWLLEGVRKYQEHGLDDTPQIVSAVDAYRREVDTVAQFVESSVEENVLLVADEAQIPVRTLHHQYTEFCRRNNARGLGERRFTQRMQSLGFERKKTASANVWVGIGTTGLIHTSYGLLGTMIPPRT